MKVARAANLHNKFNLGSFIHKSKNKIQTEEVVLLQLVVQEAQKATVTLKIVDNHRTDS